MKIENTESLKIFNISTRGLYLELTTKVVYFLESPSLLQGRWGGVFFLESPYSRRGVV